MLAFTIHNEGEAIKIQVTKLQAARPVMPCPHDVARIF